MTLTYADGQPLESGDADLLAELEQNLEAARARYRKAGLTQDRSDARTALYALRSHVMQCRVEGCEVCDEHGEVPVGVEPASMGVPEQTVYDRCPVCTKATDDYLGGI